MPEVAIRLAQLSEWERSYAHVLLYPPQPSAMLSLEGRQVSFSAKMYGVYLEEKRRQVSHGVPIAQSFLALWKLNFQNSGLLTAWHSSAGYSEKFHRKIQGALQFMRQHSSVQCLKAFVLQNSAVQPVVPQSSLQHGRLG